MHLVGSSWLIDNEAELRYKFPFYWGALDFAKEQEKIDDCRWFFDKCYINYNKDEAFIIFTSYATEEYKNYCLSIKANKNSDSNSSWNYSIQKKVTT